MCVCVCVLCIHHYVRLGLLDHLDMNHYFQKYEIKTEHRCYKRTVLDTDILEKIKNLEEQCRNGRFMIYGTWFDSSFEDETEDKEKEEEEDKQVEDRLHCGRLRRNPLEEILYGQDMSKVYQVRRPDAGRVREDGEYELTYMIPVSPGRGVP